MTTRLPAKTDTIMVSRNLHLEQVANVLDINIDLLRSINPMYRRDVVPGATSPCILRLPATDISKFIELEDSIYQYKADELMKRTEVEVKDDVPTYYHKSKRYSRGKKGRVSKRRGTVSRRRAATASKKRSTRSTRKAKSTKRRRRR